MHLSLRDYRHYLCTVCCVLLIQPTVHAFAFNKHYESKLLSALVTDDLPDNQLLRQNSVIQHYQSPSWEYSQRQNALSTTSKDNTASIDEMTLNDDAGRQVSRHAYATTESSQSPHHLAASQGGGRRERRDAAVSYNYERQGDYEYSQPVLKGAVGRKVIDPSQLPHLIHHNGNALPMKPETGDPLENQVSSKLASEAPLPSFTPFSTDENPVSDTTTEEEKLKQLIRNRESRKFFIQMSIMQRLGLKGLPQVPRNFTQKLNNGDVDRLMEQMKNETEVEISQNTPAHSGSRYSSQWLKRVAPTCEQPRGADVLSWYMRDSFRLYFAMKLEDFYPDYELSNSEETRIASAMLRLYLRPAFLLKSDSECELLNVPIQRVGKHKNRRKGKSPNAKSEDGNNQDRLRVTVYQYKYAVSKDRKQKRVIVDSVYINRRACGWVKLDVKSTVERWIRKPKSNHGVEIEVEDSTGSLIDPFDIFQSPNCSSRIGYYRRCNRPANQRHAKDTFNLMLPTACLISDVLSSRKPEISVLVVQSPNQAMPTRRKRRHLMAGEQCVRDVFEISFEDDRIIYPKTIDVGVCQGQCHLSPVNYLEPLSRSRSQVKCCQPTNTRALNMVYIDESGRRVTTSLSGLIISQCGYL